MPPLAAKHPALVDANQPYPSDEQRAAAWQAAFADDAGPFRGAFEHAAIGMAIIDLDGRFLKVNPALTRIVGFSEEELLATDFQSITHPDDLEPDMNLARQLMRGDIKHYDMKKRYFHKDGHVVWILLSASIARDESGMPCYAISQIQDITIAEAAEREAARNLRQVDRLTHTMWSIMQASASTLGEDMYGAVLRIVMQAFDSPAGVFLRFTDGETLSGPFVSPHEIRESHCWATNRCELWYDAIKTGKVVLENHSRDLNCGTMLTRSLVCPIVHDNIPLGIFHLGNASVDYDEDDRDLLLRVASIIAPVLHARMQRDKLTPREAEVMDLLVSGMSQKQIATALHISIQTTAKHRARVLEKLRLRSDVDLVHLSMQMRIPWTDGPAAALPAIPRRAPWGVKPCAALPKSRS
jgi:PAS domain S-box-containing protein